MSYKTPVVFGRREVVFIVSPDQFSITRKEIEVPDGVRIDAGQFIDIAGNKATLEKEKKITLLVTEPSYYSDMRRSNKPAGVVEGYYGDMLIRTKVYNEGTEAFSKGDTVTIIDGLISHIDANHTVAIGEVTDRGTDWIEVFIF